MKQMARNATLEQWGFLGSCRYLLHDRDGKFCPAFDQIIELGNVKPIQLPARSPNLNAFSERWVKSVKEECLSKLILFGESSLKRALQQYEVHYHEEAKRITCCFLGRLSRWGVIRDRFNVRSDWEVSSSTTIGRRHEQQSGQSDSDHRILPFWVSLIGLGCAQADGHG